MPSFCHAFKRRQILFSWILWRFLPKDWLLNGLNIHHFTFPQKVSFTVSLSQWISLCVSYCVCLPCWFTTLVHLTPKWFLSLCSFLGLISVFITISYVPWRHLLGMWLVWRMCLINIRWMGGWVDWWMDEWVEGWLGVWMGIWWVAPWIVDGWVGVDGWIDW